MEGAMKVYAAGLILLLSLSSCGKRAEEPDGASSTDVAEHPGPRINPSAAPGVAFTYAYQFRLPALRIAAVQEQHAQACEKLGLSRCRITGMRYQVRGENMISAELNLKLAPDIARKFGRDTIAAVQRAEGMVTDTQIGGADVGTAISESRSREGAIKDDILKLERESRRSGISAQVHAELATRLQDLRNELAQNGETRRGNEEALASTPMTFSYASGGLIPGFDPRSPIREALENSGWIIVGIIAFLIQLIAVILPLALFGGLGLWLWNRSAALRRRVVGRAGTES
jgi:hypothetical protein